MKALLKFLITLFSIATVFIPCSVWSQKMEINSIDLTSHKIEGNFSDASVWITVSQKLAPGVRVLVDGVSVDPRDFIDFSSDSAGTRLLTMPTSTDQTTTSRPEIRIILNPSMEASVQGNTIEVDVSIPELEYTAPNNQGNDDLAKSPFTFGTLQLEFTLSNSELRCTNIAPQSVVATNGSVFFVSTRGRSTFDLKNVALHIRNHVGPISLQAVEGNITLDRCKGNIKTNLTGIAFTADSISGNHTFKVSTSQIILDQCKGTANVSGDRSSVYVNGGAALKRVTVSGSSMGAFVQRVRGSVNFTASGGTFDGTDIHGNLDLNLSRHSHGSLIGVSGVVKLDLSGDSSIRIDGSHTALTAEVKNSTVSIDDARSIEIKSTHSRITVSEVMKIVKLYAIDSVLDLDLRATSKNIPLILLQDSSAEVRMSQPCQVKVKGRKPGIGTGIDIQRCRVTRSSIKGKSKRTETLDGSNPQILEVKIDRGSTLTVSGL